ncbi:hypothetical protein AL504_05285 [Achromobacter xylosoxidans]|uniref:Uncharacterized protein n=1 Tax=Alcaligenes xylosoxydans xylosoxydans TaxID=85698 RepID=A0A0X8NW94_ALCXX|nr:hypothetical protein AL504_05285 [Achromobacter xylosoxidans]
MIGDPLDGQFACIAPGSAVPDRYRTTPTLGHATHQQGGGADAAREPARSATISPVRTDFSRLSDAACVLCALRSTLLSSQEVAARCAYARSKPG